MKHLVLILCASFFAWSDLETIQVTKLNKFPESYGSFKPSGAFRCVGKFKIRDSRFSWAEKQLANGIDCVVADFDGNGFKDYALLKNGWTSDNSANQTTDVVVLMFDAKGLKQVLPIGTGINVFEFGLYPPTKKKGEFGEPSTKYPGLIQSGEGGETLVFIFKNGQFEGTHHVSENE